MNKLSFKTTINAPAARVWDILWNDATYRQWTAPFHEGSYAVSDWKEGSRVHFLGPSGEGMYSVIDQLRSNEFMSFKHLGMVKDGKEQPIDEETKKWTGAMENYTLTEREGVTELDVELDGMDDHKEYFDKTFPEALSKVKQLSEA